MVIPVIDLWKGRH